MWPIMIEGTPASIAARKGTNSQVSSWSRVRVLVALPVWESPIVSPWPGKCLAQQAVPVPAKPSTSAFTMEATRSGSLPKEREAMTVLSGLVSTSATGARSSVKPMSCR